MPIQLRTELKKKIVAKVVKEKKYLDKNYSARQLAADLGVDVRNISAVFSVEFKENYASLINRFRVRMAARLLKQQRAQAMTMEEIALLVGFSTRQTLYKAFAKVHGMTPAEFKNEYGFTGEER